MMKKENPSQLMDFLSDDSFVRWIRNGTDDTNEKWDQWLQENPKKADLVSEAKLYLSLLQRPTHSMEFDRKEKLRSKILEQISGNQGVVTNSRGKNTFFATEVKVWQIAASALIFLSMLSLLYMFAGEGMFGNTLISVNSDTGQTKSIELSDGTKVILSAKSSIEYPEVFDQEIREVKLVGEASFDVTTDIDKPFVVKSKHLSTKVLGTVFNVKAYEKEDPEVYLIEGKVMVYETDNIEDQQILNPTEMVTYHLESAQFSRGTFEVDESLAWLQNRIVFKNADLDDLKRVIERWYDVDITYINKPDRAIQFNSEYQNISLDKLLKTTGLALGFDPFIKGRTVKIIFLSE